MLCLCSARDRFRSCSCRKSIESAACVCSFTAVQAAWAPWYSCVARSCSERARSAAAIATPCGSSASRAKRSNAGGTKPGAVQNPRHVPKKAFKYPNWPWEFFASNTPNIFPSFAAAVSSRPCMTSLAARTTAGCGVQGSAKGSRKISGGSHRKG